MKKVEIKINGSADAKSAKNISKVLNDLSGVVAADVAAAGGMATAYAGDRLTGQTMEEAVEKAGYGAKVVKETYLHDMNDWKNSLQ